MIRTPMKKKKRIALTAPERNRKKYEVAIYHRDRLRQEEIAKKVGISRPLVSRLVNEAMDDGIIKIQLNLPREKRLRDRLIKQYDCLDEAIVVRVPEMATENLIRSMLGEAGGEYLNELFCPNITVAIGYGLTIRECIKAHEPSHNKIKFNLYAATVAPTFEHVDLSPNTLIGMLTAKYPNAKAHGLFTPFFCQGKQQKKGFSRIPMVAEVFRRVRNADLLMTGIGEFGHLQKKIIRKIGLFERLKKERIISAGDIMFRLFGHDGEPIPSFLDEVTMTLDLTDLRRMLKEKKQVLAVAGGRRKLEAIRAALVGGYFNILITDELTAKKLLEEHGNVNPAGVPQRNDVGK